MTSCLIIDDDRLFRQVASDILTSQGYDVIQAASGQAGLEMFRSHPTDLVLLDLILPDGTGTDLIPEFGQQGSSSRVIITTSYFSLDSALEVLRKGAGDYLPKPFTEEGLLMSAERVLKRVALEMENQELSLQLKKRVDELSLLHEISQLITSSKTMEDWIDEVVRSTSTYIGAQAGSLLLLDASREELFFYVSTGPKSKATREVRLPKGQGIAWWCLTKQETVKVDNVTEDPRFSDNVDVLTGFVTRNILAAPITVDAECIGVIELVNKIDAPNFTNEDLKRLEELSSHIAAAVQNAMTVRDLMRSRKELETWSQQLEQLVEERTRALKEAHLEREKAYKNLESSHRMLKQAQSVFVEREKMAAVGMLSAGVAHEINNPLGFVRANLATLEQYVRALRRLAAVTIHASNRSRWGKADEIMQLLKEASRVVEEESIREVLDDLDPLFDEMSTGLTRITSIVEQLRSFAEDGTDQDSDIEIDINMEINHLVELIRKSLHGKIDIQCELTAVPFVRVSQKKLRQMLLNLLSSGSLLEENQKYLLRTTMYEDQVVFEVLNHESELTQNDLDRLFDPFYGPGDGIQPGGLGLSAAYGLARSMGGSLRAFKHPEGGICIQLLLPKSIQTLHFQKELPH